MKNFKNKGMTLVEVMIAIGLSSVVLVGGIQGYNSYQENKEIDDKESITAQKIARFSNATYQYIRTAEGVDLDNNIIDSQTLIDSNILPSGFSPNTPFNQEIKAFVEKEASGDDYYIYVTTTGNMSGDVDNPSTIYRDLYSKMLQQNLDIPSDRFIYGQISNNQFNSVTLNRDIVPSNDFLLEQGQEIPSVLIISEDLSPELDQEIRVLSASPEFQNPASGTHYSTITASIRNEDGDPVPDEQIFWNTSMGNLRDADTITNQDGVSENRIYSNDVGNARIQAKIAGDTKYIDVEFSPPYIELSTTQASVNADGSTCFNVLADVKYPAGQIADYELLNWGITSSSGVLNSFDNSSDDEGFAQACVTSEDGGEIILKASLDEYPTVEDSITLDFNSPIIYDVQVNGTDVKNDGEDFYEIIPRIAFPDGTPLFDADIEWETTTGFFDENPDKQNDVTSSDASGYSVNRFYSEVAGTNSLTISIDGDSRDISIGFIGPVILDLYYEYTVNDELVRYSEQIAQCIGDGGEIKMSKTADIYALVGYEDGTLVGEDYPVRWGAVVDGSTENSVTRTNEDSIATVAFSQDDDSTQTYSISASIPGSTEEKSIEVPLGENGARILLLEAGEVNNISLSKGDTLAYVKSCFDDKCEIGNGNHNLEVGKIYQYSVKGNAHKFWSCDSQTNSDCSSGKINNSPHINNIAESTNFPSNGKPYWTNIGDNKEILLIKGECTNGGGGNNGGGNSGGGNNGGGNSGGDNSGGGTSNEYFQASVTGCANIELSGGATISRGAISGGNITMSGNPDIPPRSIIASGKIKYPYWWKNSSKFAEAVSSFQENGPSLSCDPMNLAEKSQQFDSLSSNGDISVGNYPYVNSVIRPNELTSFDETWNVKEDVVLASAVQTELPDLPSFQGKLEGEYSVIKTGDFKHENASLTVSGGDVILYVDGDFLLGDGGGGTGFTIESGSTLTVIVTGKTTVKSAVKTGLTSTVNTNGRPTFALYSLYEESSNKVDRNAGVFNSGDNDVVGNIYAPYSNVFLGERSYLKGTVRGKAVKINGASYIYR